MTVIKAVILAHTKLLGYHTHTHIYTHTHTHAHTHTHTPTEGLILEGHIRGKHRPSNHKEKSYSGLI